MNNYDTLFIESFFAPHNMVETQPSSQLKSMTNSTRTSLLRPKDVRKSMMSELKRLKSTIQKARDDLQDACDSDKAWLLDRVNNS